MTRTFPFRGRGAQGFAFAVFDERRLIVACPQVLA